MDSPDGTPVGDDSGSHVGQPADRAQDATGATVTRGPTPWFFRLSSADTMLWASGLVFLGCVVLAVLQQSSNWSGPAATAVGMACVFYTQWFRRKHRLPPPRTSITSDRDALLVRLPGGTQRLIGRRLPMPTADLTIKIAKPFDEASRLIAGAVRAVDPNMTSRPSDSTVDIDGVIDELGNPVLYRVRVSLATPTS